MDTLRKLILSKCPDYDFERYHFSSGDYVETLDGARILVTEPALEYTHAYVLVRSLKYREKGLQRISYKDLPYYKKGTFVNKLPKLNTSKKWKLYDLVFVDEYFDMIVLLDECIGHQRFYAYVISSENKYYLNTRIYIENPYKDYIACT